MDTDLHSVASARGRSLVDWHDRLVETEEMQGGRLAFGQYSLFVRGAGQFGGARTSEVEKVSEPLPRRAPDAIVEQRTSIEQAQSDARRAALISSRRHCAWRFVRSALAGSLSPGIW